MNKNIFYEAFLDADTLQKKADFVTLVASVEGADVPSDAVALAMEFYKKTDQYRRAESLSDFTGVVDEDVESWKNERKQAELEKLAASHDLCSIGLENYSKSPEATPIQPDTEGFSYVVELEAE